MYGVGVVISHIIAFALQVLLSSEQNNPPIEKEALLLIYGMNKFHSYLYGWKFTLEIDHKL